MRTNLQQQDKTNLFSILIKRNPKIVNDNSIIFEVDNDLVKDMLSAELQSLCSLSQAKLKQWSSANFTHYSESRKRSKKPI
jgi:hypothetical protein